MDKYNQNTNKLYSEHVSGYKYTNPDLLKVVVFVGVLSQGSK